MDALLRCSRYAFGPNRLHYCGPAKNTEMRDYINDETADLGLREILEDFETMYPYLLHIARANKIDDPLNDRVVEAYWVGNELLDRVSKNDLYWHLVDNLSLKKKLGKSFALVEEKVAGGAVPHHSFHVLDIWKRTGFIEREHTLESMDSCRISWGTVLAIDGSAITVTTEPLVIQNGKLALGSPISKKITRNLEADIEIDELKNGDLISIHWGVPCEVLTKKQEANLLAY